MDTSINEPTKNESSRSVILAPFNSTQKEDSSCEFHESVLPSRVVRFGSKVREIDRQYERNNNCELDNGVYNKPNNNEVGNLNNNQFDPFDGVDKIDERDIVVSPKDTMVARRRCKPVITESAPLIIGIAVSRHKDAMYFGEFRVS